MVIWLLRTGEGPKYEQGWGSGKYFCRRCPRAEHSDSPFGRCRGYCAPHDPASDGVTESDSSAHSEADTKAHAARAH